MYRYILQSLFWRASILKSIQKTAENFAEVFRRLLLGVI